MKYLLALLLFSSCTPKYYWEINTALMRTAIQHENRIRELEFQLSLQQNEKQFKLQYFHELNPEDTKEILILPGVLNAQETPCLDTVKIDN